MKTALTDRLGLDLPIIQAPMARTSTPELAAAVSNAGALGSISIASVDGSGAGNPRRSQPSATPPVTRRHPTRSGLRNIRV